MESKENGDGQGIGASVRRVEDYRFLTGQGRYTDDLKRLGQKYAYILRSPHANANLKTVATAAAVEAPGVVAVYTGQDLKADGVGSLPCGWLIKDKNGADMKEPLHPPLAVETVRHVGDQVAVVIADTLAQARHAADLIEVDYDVKEAVVDMVEAGMGGTLVHTELGSNVCYDWELGSGEEIEAALANSHHVTELDLVQNRLIANAIEPRAAIGEYDAGTGMHTLYTTSQNPHLIRLLMGAFVLNIPEHKLRVVAPDVGGGFGSKIYHYAEEAIVTWAAKKLKVPVKWTAERSESFMSDAHGRDHVTKVRLGLDADGNFTALAVDTHANMGAYLSTFSTCVPTYLYATLLAGVYTTPKIYCNVKAIFTNTVPVDAYRGAGRPEASYLIERVVDKAAREIGMDRVELRRKNLIAPSKFPYQTPVALQYDSGNYEASLDKALGAADWDGFAKRLKESEVAGKLRGIGLSCYIEACGIAPSAVVGSLGARAGLFESCTVRVNPTGSVTVLTGSHAHGQGHETTFSQLVHERLGIPIKDIQVVHGDTRDVPFGMGTYGSRSLAVGGEALMRALDKIVAKASKIAAHMLEADASDLEIKGDKFTVKGTDKTLGFGDVAMQAYVPHNFPHKTAHDDPEGLEPGLEEQAFYDPLNFTYPSGTHICEVEIDPDTGLVEVVSFTACDDFGTIVNPMIVEGQVHGGLVQGIGQALLENAVYDSDGQLLTGSYMDYAMPRASDVPSFNVSTISTPSTHNQIGSKGCGEAGAIGAPPAVINAVLHALSAKGVEDLTMPASPARVWAAIDAAGNSRG